MATNPTATTTKRTISKLTIQREWYMTMACSTCHGSISFPKPKLEETVACPLCEKRYTFRGEIHDETLFEVE